MGIPPPNKLFQKFKVFNLLSYKHEVFEASKYKKDKIWPKFGGTKMGGSPPKRGGQNSTF